MLLTARNLLRGNQVWPELYQQSALHIPLLAERSGTAGEATARGFLFLAGESSAGDDSAFFRGETCEDSEDHSAHWAGGVNRFG